LETPGGLDRTLILPPPRREVKLFIIADKRNYQRCRLGGNVILHVIMPPTFAAI
jgi:hypothetical protein